MFWIWHKLVTWLNMSVWVCLFILCGAAFLLLASSHFLWFSAGVILMGVAHAAITVKGTHLASHGALSQSQVWGKMWAVFFIEVRKDWHQAEAQISGRQLKLSNNFYNWHVKKTESWVRGSFEFWGFLWKLWDIFFWILFQNSEEKMTKQKKCEKVRIVF